MTDLPRVTLRVVGSTETSSALVNTQRVYAVIDGEVAGEVSVTSAEIRMQAGEPARVLLETLVAPRFAEVDLRPDREEMP